MTVAIVVLITALIAFMLGLIIGDRTATNRAVDVIENFEDYQETV